MIVPRVTTNLPLKSMQLDPNWKHLSDIQFADSEFGSPGKIDLLLAVDVFIRILLNGWRCGPPGSPTALQTEFDWVLAGVGTSCSTANYIISNHVSVLTGDDLLRKFWEIEDGPGQSSMVFSPREVNSKAVCYYTQAIQRWQVHCPTATKPDAKVLGESRA